MSGLQLSRRTAAGTDAGTVAPIGDSRGLETQSGCADPAQTLLPGTRHAIIRRSALGCGSLTNFTFTGPIDHVVEPDFDFVQLAVRPSHDNGRAALSNRSGLNRLEPIGSVFFLPATQAIRFQSECKQHTSLAAFFDAAALVRWFEGKLPWCSDRIAATLDIRDPLIDQLLRRLEKEIRYPGFASECVIDLIMAEIAVALVRFNVDAEGRGTIGGLAPWRLRLVEERVNDSGKRPTLEELAALCQMSPRHLSRAFRASRGMSIGDYVARQRSERAQWLLSQGRNIKGIASELGFRSTSHFHLAFRRATAQSPAEYRARFGAKPGAPENRHAPNQIGDCDDDRIGRTIEHPLPSN